MDNIQELRTKYYESIKLLQNEADIIDSLPQPDYGNFFTIITGLIQCLDDELIELEQELESVSSSNDEMKEYIEEEIKTLQFKKEICASLLDKGIEDNLIEEESEKISKKNIIFATTNSGNICIENDLKTLPEEYYESAIDLLHRLQNGAEENNIEKARPLTTVNKKMAGIHEIKDFKVRMFYKNLAADTVYILMIRMKKSNNDALDRKEIIDRISQRNGQYEKLKLQIKNKQFKEQLISENEKAIADICDYLSNNKRGK